MTLEDKVDELLYVWGAWGYENGRGGSLIGCYQRRGVRSTNPDLVDPVALHIDGQLASIPSEFKMRGWLKAAKLRYVGGMYIEVAAERMGVSRSTFKALLDQLRSYLAGRLDVEDLYIKLHGGVDRRLTAN